MQDIKVKLKVEGKSDVELRRFWVTGNVGNVDPVNDGSTFVRSFLRWIFRCIVTFFRAFPETPLNMNARALLLQRLRFVTVHWHGAEMGFVGGGAGMLLD